MAVELADLGANRLDQVVTPLIDGALSPSSSDRTVDVSDPSTGRQCLSIPAGCDADVDAAVKSARRAFANGCWRDMPPSARKQILHRFADAIEAAADVLDRFDAGEMGKPIGLAFGNARGAADLVRFYAESIDKVIGDVYCSDKQSLVVQRRVPRGVVAAIVPWNFPTFVAVFKIAPALAAGNSVVLKPSELSSRSAIRLAQLALEAGVPPGVLNVVPGLGETVGRAMGLHMDVDMVTFTGSTEVGKRLLGYSAQSNMKAVMNECGGKSPHIVFDDGLDLDAVAERIAQMLLINQGQLCSLGSRLLLPKAIEARMLDKMTPHLKTIVMGNALDATTTFGPLASAQQFARVQRYINAGSSEGAQLVVGGRRVMQESGGYFVEPTIFSGVSPSATIAQEEIFGPVLAVTTFKDEADAFRIANDSTYGLLATVWTSNMSTGMRAARAIPSTIIINATIPNGEGPGHAASFEPARQSGLGPEGGLAGMEAYLRRQVVWLNHA